ncbi:MULTISPECIES: hypothetical protein [Pseudomonas]|nr:MULTISPECIES: hypothetical protein [Pseudomonas]MDI3393297.1 hypothetical protein [Pseudomonas sp. V98_8]
MAVLIISPAIRANTKARYGDQSARASSMSQYSGTDTDNPIAG